MIKFVYEMSDNERLEYIKQKAKDKVERKIKNKYVLRLKYIK